MNVNWLWYTKVQSKINSFLWLCWHNRIKIDLLLHIRKLFPSPKCSIFPSQDETINHIIFSCPLAISIWKQLSTECITLTKRLNLNLKNHISLYVKWHPPTHPSVKLNIDNFSTLQYKREVLEVSFKNYKRGFILWFWEDFYCNSCN